MTDHWRSFHDVVTAIELQVDAAGDTLYHLVHNYGSPAEDRIRWANESHDALVTACDGLHALARVAEEVRSSNRERVVRDVADAAPDSRSEPNPARPDGEGDAAASATNVSKIATAGVTASGDTEERALAPNPQHTPAVAHEPKDAA